MNTSKSSKKGPAICLTIIFILLLILAPTMAWAQSQNGQTGDNSTNQSASGEKPSTQKNLSKTTVPEMVVTASRRPEALKNVPSYTTVIGSEELAASPAQSVDDVLRSQAGLDFWGSDIAYGGFRAVTLRGMGGSNDQGRTLILVDGLPVNDTWDGNVAWSQISKEDVARIEIVRGPASALYGGSALGGVINIITKSPTDKEFSTRLKAGYGSLDRYVGYANFNGKVNDGKIGYYFSAKKDKNSGYKAIKDYDGPYESDTDHDMYNLFGKLYYYPSENSSLNITASRFHEVRNRGYVYSNTDPRIIEKVNATYKLDNPDALSMLASLYYQKNDQTTEFTNSRKQGKSPAYSLYTANETKDKPFWGAILQPSYALADWNTLTVGFEFKHCELEYHNTTFDDPDIYQDITGNQEYYALYAQDEAFFFQDRLVLTLGARMDWWRNFDGSYKETDPDNPGEKSYPEKKWDSFNPKFGAVFHATDYWSWRTAIGTGYRAPTPARMYTDLKRGGRVTYGNPDLDPEQVLSYELGTDFNIGSWATINLTAYYAKLRDMISSRTIVPNSTSIYDNIGEVSSRGVEAAATVKFHDFWRGYTNFTYNKSKIDKDEETPANEGNILEFSPEAKFNAGITFDRPDWFLASLQARYVDSMYADNENTEQIDAYWTVDFKIAKKFLDCLTADFSVENLLDEKYDWACYTTEYEAPGTLVMFTLTYEY